MTIKSYENNVYQQDLCSMCWVSFGSEEVDQDPRIIELGCKHIFHAACLTETYVTCMVCKKFSAKDLSNFRDYKINTQRQLIKALVHSIFYFGRKNIGRISAWYLESRIDVALSNIERKIWATAPDNALLKYQHQVRTLTSIEKELFTIFEGSEESQNMLIHTHLKAFKKKINEFISRNNESVNGWCVVDNWLTSLDVDIAKTPFYTATTAIKILIAMSLGFHYLAEHKELPSIKIPYLEKFKIALSQDRHIKVFKSTFRALLRKKVKIQRDQTFKSDRELKNYLSGLTPRMLTILELSKDKQVQKVAQESLQTKVKTIKAIHIAFFMIAITASCAILFQIYQAINKPRDVRNTF